MMVSCLGGEIGLASDGQRHEKIANAESRVE
jgi:hypothetical protein